MNNKDFIFEIYKDQRTVFTIKEISLIINESDLSRLKQKVNYYVRKGYLINIRRGVYIKKEYDIEELACKIYIPSYISLEYVLRKAGVIFQYSEKISNVSYLSRTIEVGPNELVYRKIKNEILINTASVVRNTNGVNIATPERAFLDILYLNKDFYFDNISGLNIKLINKLLPIYRSKRLLLNVNNIIKNA